MTFDSALLFHPESLPCNVASINCHSSSQLLTQLFTHTVWLVSARFSSSFLLPESFPFSFWMEILSRYLASMKYAHWELRKHQASVSEKKKNAFCIWSSSWFVFCPAFSPTIWSILSPDRKDHCIQRLVFKVKDACAEASPLPLFNCRHQLYRPAFSHQRKWG